MTKKVQQRNQHSEEFKTETLQLASRIGVTDAARQLGLHASQIKLYGLHFCI